MGVRQVAIAIDKPLLRLNPVRLLVVIGDKAIDDSLEINDALEDPAPEAALGQDGMECPTRMFRVLTLQLTGWQPTRLPLR